MWRMKVQNLLSTPVQANLLALTVENEATTNQVYNAALGDRTCLNDLHYRLRESLVHRLPHLKDAQPTHRNFRGGDVRDSLADISETQRLLGYLPSHRIDKGLKDSMAWYVSPLT